MAAGAPNSCFQDSGNAQYRRAIEASAIDIDTGRMLLRQLMVCRTPSRDPTLPRSLPRLPPSESGVPLLVRIRRPPLLQPLAAGDFSLEGPIRRPAGFPSQSTRPIGGAGKQGAAALMVAHTPFPLAHLTLPSVSSWRCGSLRVDTPLPDWVMSTVYSWTDGQSEPCSLPTTTAISNRKRAVEFRLRGSGLTGRGRSGNGGALGPFVPPSPGASLP